MADTWESVIVDGYCLADLDRDEIEQTIRAGVDSGHLEKSVRSSGTLLDQLALHVGHKLKRAAIVLFGRELLGDFPQCGIRMGRFADTDKLAGLLVNRQLHGNAFRLLAEGEAFVRRHASQYPAPAIREALVNAICHRDYVGVSGAVCVAVYDSPGLLGKPTNPLIAEAFRLRGLAGNQGIKRMMAACEAAGMPAPAFEAMQHSVVVRFMAPSR